MNKYKYFREEPKLFDLLTSIQDIIDHLEAQEEESEFLYHAYDLLNNPEDYTIEEVEEFIKAFDLQAYKRLVPVYKPLNKLKRLEKRIKENEKN